MPQESKLIKEQERYLVENYSHQSNTDIAKMLTIIGESYNRAMSEDMLLEAKSLTGLAKAKAEKRAMEMIIAKPITDKTVMYYGAKMGLRKSPEFMGRPCNKKPSDDFMTIEDSCKFFRGSYINEVRDAVLFSGRRFLYFKDEDHMNEGVMKVTLARYNRDEGKEKGVVVTANYFSERNLIILKVTALSCAPVPYTDPASSAAPQLSRS